MLKVLLSCDGVEIPHYVDRSSLDHRIGGFEHRQLTDDRSTGEAHVGVTLDFEGIADHATSTDTIKILVTDLLGGSSGSLLDPHVPTLETAPGIVQAHEVALGGEDRFGKELERRVDVDSHPVILE